MVDGAASTNARACARACRQTADVSGDGRAHTLEEAILAHDGQGRRAKDRFTALPAYKRASLVAFLNTL